MIQRLYKFSPQHWSSSLPITQVAALFLSTAWNLLNIVPLRVCIVLVRVDYIVELLGIDPYTEKREEVFQWWKEEIAELSTCTNVVVKMGGLGMLVCSSF